MIGAPIGNNEAFKSNFVLQQLFQGVGIVACKYSVDLVIRAHNRCDASLYGGRKGSRVDLMQRLLAHHYIVATVVSNVVLGLGHHSLALNAFNLSGPDCSDTERIFTEEIIRA